MATHIVIDGNAFYEVDEECLKRMEEKEKNGEKTILGGRERSGRQNGKYHDRDDSRQNGMHYDRDESRQNGKYHGRDSSRQNGKS